MQTSLYVQFVRVYMCVSICACERVRVCAWLHACMHAYVHVCRRICMCMCMCVWVHVLALVCVAVGVCVGVWECVSMSASVSLRSYVFVACIAQFCIETKLLTCSSVCFGVCECV